VIRRLLTGLLLAAPLCAQLTFSVVTESVEAPVSAQVQLPPAAVGNTLDTHFRLRNTGHANAPVSAITIGGTGFSLTNLPDLPSMLAQNAYFDFTVRFQPAIVASYSAILKSDLVTVFLMATAVPVAKVYVEENGTRRPLDPLRGLDFGAVERGTQVSRRLVLVNDGPQAVISILAIAGNAFQFAPGTAAAAALDPQKSTFIDLVYAPASAGPQQGELRIDTRRFPLLGTTVEPPLPRPIVMLDFQGAPPASAKQALASVRFDPPPRVSGAGTLRVEFHPSVTVADDPAVLFLTTGSRAIDFSVIETVTDAQFGPTTTIPLQTGTTAGTIVVTAALGDYQETAVVEIPPQPVTIDDVQMTHTTAGVDVQISGFDNTRTLSGASFTFLQSSGAVLPPGAIQQDLSALFRDYFAGSTTGGSFSLKLSFPVTGSAASVDSVRVVMTNAAGQTSWPSPQ
jgi:hypothetical protein